jgi:hypothetical protein
MMHGLTNLKLKKNWGSHSDVAKTSVLPGYSALSIVK